MASIHDLLMQFRGEDVSLGSTLQQSAAELEAFGQLDPTAELHVDTRDAKAKLDEVSAELAQFALKSSQAKVGVDVGDARAKLDEFKAALDSVDRDKASPEVNMKLARAYADVASFAALLDEATRNRDVKIDVDKSLISRLTGMAGAAESLAGDLEKVAPAADSAGGGMGNLASQIPIVGGFSGQTAAVIAGVLVPTITALVAALGALVASLAFAAAGLGALAVAGAAAFGPIAGLALLAFQQISKASTAATTYASAQQQVKSASDSLSNAEDGLSKAQAQQQQAQGALTRARQQAAQQIRSDLTTAIDGVTSAEEAVSSANYQARQSEQALTLARQAARRALVDERLAAEGAALGHAGSVLQLREARRNLSQLQAARGTRGGPTGLDLAEARQQVAEAEFQVESTRVQSTRAENDLNTAEAQGVQQNPGVVQARHNVSDAEQQQRDTARQLAEAEAKLHAAQNATVDQSPSVISARQGVASADQQAADATKAVADASERLDYAQRKAAKAQKAFDATSAARGLMRNARQLERLVQPAIDPLIRGMRRGIQEVEPLLERLRPVLVALGRTVGQTFVRLADELTRPVWQRFFDFLLRSSSRFARDGTTGFILLLRILRNIARDAMPFLLKGMRDLNGFLRDAARGSRSIDLSEPMKQLGLWLRLMYQLGRVFLNFIRAAEGPGGSLVKWLTRGAKALADWEHSAGGRDALHRFFASTLPLARSLVELFGQLLVALLQLGEFAAPVLQPIVGSLTQFARLLNFVLNLLNKIPAPIRGAFGEVLTSGGPAGLLLHHLGTVTSALADAWRALEGVAKRVWGSIGDAIKGGVVGAYHWLHDHSPTAILQNHWGDIQTLAAHIWGQIGGSITAGPRAAYGGLRTATGSIADFLSGRFKDIRSFTGKIWQGVAGNIGKGMSAVFGWLRGALHTLAGVFHKVWGGIVDIVHAAVQGVRDAVNGIVHSINWVLDKLNAVKDKIAGAVPSVGGGGVDIPIVGHVDPTPGFDIPGIPFGAKGMVVKSPQYVVGEEAPAHPEVVIASNPRYRERNVGLWAKAGQMLGIPGFAKGGIYRYPFPSGPSPQNLGRTDEGVDIGGPGTPIAAIGDAVVTSLSNYFSGSGFGAPNQGLVYKLLGGAPKGYTPSSPYIYTFEDFNRRVGMGRLHAGQTVGSVASGSFGIETGWAADGGGKPLAQVTGGINPNTHYSAAGASFVRFITDLFSGKTIAGGGGAKLGKLNDLIASMKKLQSQRYGHGPLSGIARGALGTIGDAAVPYLQAVAKRLSPRVSGARGVGGVGYVPPGSGGVVEEVARILAQQGFSRTAAAGILGNAYRESLPPWNPASVGTGGGGLWGFTTPPRSLADLQAFARRSGKPWTDVGIQTQFMLEQGGLALRGALNAQPSAAAAARYFEQNWEHAGVVAMSERVHGAKIALKIIQGMHGHQFGGSLGKAALGLIGGERGTREMALLPRGTEVVPADLTKRLAYALGAGRGPARIGHDGGGFSGGDVYVEIYGDIVSDDPNPVRVRRGGGGGGAAATEVKANQRHLAVLEGMDD